MALTKYKEKRNSKESPEPAGGAADIEKSRGKKISVPKMKVVHKQSDNLMDMLKASLAVKKSKSA